ncbi:MAG: S-layer homology domain-containing protein [Candidatus Gracilibacteria bacterium]|nr:S-layer homology domain-containing protein [Candidatus Gracilibacteria bacterium]
MVAIVASAMSSTLVANAASSFAPYADALATAGIIAKQSTEAGYNLGDNVTRAEMAKIAVNIKSATVTECTGKVFSDVTAAHSLCKYVEAAKTAGLTTLATGTKYRPNESVTRAEALKMLLSAKGIAPSTEDAGFTDLGSDASLNGYINAAAKMGIVNKGVSFNPNGTASRGEAFKIAANSAGLTTTATAENGDDLNLGDLFGDTTATGSTVSTGTTSTGSTTVTPVGVGDLSVALGASSSANGTQVPMAGIIKFAAVDFTAGGSDIALSSVELKKAGLSTVSSSTKVWFEKNGLRLSGKSSFTSEGTVTLSFAPALVVKAGSTESVDLYVELADTVSGTDYQFVSGAVTSSAKTVSGSFMTPVLRTANYSVATYSITSASTGSDYKGSNDVVELGAFTVEANKPSTVTETRDEKVQSITFYQSGSASLTNLSDIVLVRNGLTVSTAAVVSGKSLTFVINDTIKDGTSGIYYVKAKIANVEQVKDYYQFYVKNSSDVNIIEVNSSFRASVKVAASIPVSSSLYSVNGGDIKFEKDAATALSANYAPGATDVVLMKGQITAKNAVRLEDPTVSIASISGGNLSAYFNTVYLVIGSSVFSATATGTTNDTIKFSGTVTVSGTQTVKLYGTLKSDSAVPTGTIKFGELTLSSFTGTNEYVVNQNRVETAVGSVPAVSVTVDTTSLNVNRNDGLGATNLAQGSKGVTLYGVQLTSSKGNPINVTSASFAFASNNASTSTGMLNNVYVTLYVDGVAVSSKTIDTTSAIKFDGFTTSVSSSKTVNLAVKADLSDTFASGTLVTTLSTLAAYDSISSKSVTPSSLPAGATFTVKAADATLAASDSNPQAQLFLAGSAANKMFAFKVTAKNDNITLKDVVLTGSNLGSMSNFALRDANNTLIAYASTSDTGAVSFLSVPSAVTATAMDSSATFYVTADANSNTDTGAINLSLSGVVIKGTNGSETTVAPTSTVVSKTHGIAQNTLVIAKATNSSKELTSSALRFTVTAAGKDLVTLNSITGSVQLSAYTGATEVRVYKDTISATNLAFTGALGADKLWSATTSNAKNTVDAGTTATYIVVVENAIGDGTNGTKDWTVSLKDVKFGGTLNATNYYNVGSFPMTEVK